MELWTPVRAHAEWITLLRETLYGRAALAGDLVEDDQACEVGQWLRRHENSLGHVPEFRIAKEAHATFHQRAAHCFRLAKAGHRLEALAETERDGEFRRSSRRLVKAFQDMKRIVRQRDLPVSWEVEAEAPGLHRPL